MKPIIRLSFVCFPILLLVGASTGEADEATKKQMLKLFPQTDSDQDGILSDAEVTAASRKILERYPRTDRNGDGALSDSELKAVLRMAANRARSKRDSKRASSNPAQTAGSSAAGKWNTPGFQRSNTLGAGAGGIASTGKLRVFVLMGQSNMAGAAKASELEAPYNEKHDRVRIWANGRWEYLVPQNKFGPEVSMSHELAKLWPNDTIGIIKVSVGGTGIRGFEKNWSRERANRTSDGMKGPLYKDMTNAVAEAQKVSKLEFCGFVWKQGGADGSKEDLAREYYETFKQLVADIRTDLDAPDLPTFVLTYATDKELEQVDESANKRRYIKLVLAAHNRAGRDIANTITVHHGMLPCNSDGIHFNTEGQLTLGRMTAKAVEEFYETER